LIFLQIVVFLVHKTTASHIGTHCNPKLSEENSHRSMHVAATALQFTVT